MSKPTAPNQSVARDVCYKVGDVCDYWLRFGHHQQELAIAEGLLDSCGKLTQEGFDVIVLAQKKEKDREALMRSLKPRGGGLRGKLKVSGFSQKISASSRYHLGVSKALNTRRQARSGFIKEVKACIGKINSKFVHFGEDVCGYRLVVRIPNEKGGTNTRTLSGTVSDIRRKLNALIIEVEEAIKTNRR